MFDFTSPALKLVQVTGVFVCDWDGFADNDGGCRLKNTMKRLFVIGNGFDLHHGLPTSLNDFRKFMKRRFPEEYHNIMCFFEKYFTREDARNWNELETMLSYTRDIEEMLDKAIASSEPDIDKASYWNDIQYNASVSENELCALMDGLDRWIDSISASNVSPKSTIQFVSSDTFLNFNYTDSLQKLYGVEDKQIFHIHGSASTNKILGHNEPYDEFPLTNISLTPKDIEYGLEEDWRIEEAKEILNRIPAIFFKDSASIIQVHHNFFEKLKAYDHILFMGWSLGKQDEIYMDAIMPCIANETAICVVGYSTNALEVYKEYFERRGYSKNRASYYLWEEIDSIL